MHKVEIRREIVERVTARRGRLHLYDSLDPKRTALVVIDMQNAFVAPGSPLEVPGARGIVAPINRLAAQLRRRGVLVIWIAHENRQGGADWTGYYDAFVAPGKRAAVSAALSPGAELQKLWPGLELRDGDLRLPKNRYSAFIRSDFENVLRGRGIDTLLIAGTKTNVCCECTARDAMMLDYKVVMLSDCTAALSDEEQRATLENVIQQFGDVLTADEALGRLDAPIAVRRAVPGDAAAACELVRRSITELCVDDHRRDSATLAAWLANKTPANFSAWISSPRHLALTAQKGGTIAGFALLNSSGTIALLYVAPESRFAGVSKALLASLEKHAATMGITQLALESSVTALAFYERRGYLRTGDAVQGFGVTHCYSLAKTL